VPHWSSRRFLPAWRRNRQEEVIVKAAMHTAPLAATKTQSFEYDSNDVRAV
jgi:heme-degrading monooxygenase HmoA